MKAHLIGGGISSLAAAAYLIKDGDLLGSNIYVYEATSKLGGALDAGGSPETGYTMRGGRMFEEKYTCTRDLLNFIPSITDPTKSVKQDILDFYESHAWHNKARLIGPDGEVVDAEHFGLSERDRLDLVGLSMKSEGALEGKRIADCFQPSFFETNYWFMFATIFAFVPWHSAIEMQRYLARFIHLLPTMATMSAVQRTRFNQYEAIVTPLTDWLGRLGVNLLANTQVTNIDFKPSREEITANRLHLLQNDKKSEVDLAPDDLVFVTNGSMVADASRGSMTHSPELVTSKQDGSWALWETLARGRHDFGNPSVFSDHVEESAWESFTVTCSDPLYFQLMEKLSGREAGGGGLMTLMASNWLLTLTRFHQPHYTDQPQDVFLWWGYGLYLDRPGNYVKKMMRECSGTEILEEILHHLKFDAHLDKIIESSTCIPCLLPYAGSVFMLRRKGDRPKVVPEGSTNFAFLGQFTEMPDDVVFTVEYSVRSAQTAVFKLLKLDKEPPPVYKGHHNLKVLYDAVRALRS